MAEPQTDDQETMLASGDRDTEDSQDASTSDIQVKEEPEDTGYERASAASVLSDQNSTTDSRNSSPLPAVHFENSSPSQTRDSSPLPNQSGSSTPQSSTQIPLNDLFAGSTIRTQLQGAIAGKKMDTVQNIVEGLLKKNETLLAMSDAGGYKPNARRVRAAHDGFVKRSEPGFPPQGQSRVFPVSTRLQARMNASKRTADSLKQCMIRPKSPTRRHDGLMKDKTHFSYALMESNTADHEIEDIFNVQNHELVCAIGSKSMITDKSNKVVASLEFSYYWCNFCPFSTNNKSLLIQHVVDHRFCCKYCPYESFCRSDIVRHMNKMHQDFQEIADRMSYCTMLSDYLRVKSRLNGKENADPDEDVGDFSPDVTASSIPRTSGRKRRGEETHHEEAVPTEKAAKFDQWEKDKDKAASRKERPGKSRKSQNPKRLPPPKDTDYDMFEMEVEEISDAPTGRAAEEAETDKIMYSSTRSPPNIQTDVPAFPTGMMQVLPTLQGGSMQTFTTSPAPAPAPSPSAGRNTGKGNFSTRGRYSRSNRSSSSSSLYWSCGYCSFQSLSQAEIKEHSNVKHPGKPHRYVALIKNMTPETAIHPSPRGNLARCANKPIQVQDESSTEYDGSSSVPQSSEDQTNGEGVVSLKEGTDSPNLLKVKFNTPKAVSNTVLRCYHCPYTAKRHSSMKSHIYYRHRGKGLVAVDDESDSGDQVFFCARDDCTFKSESGLLFLQHVDQCTPWNKPELADVEVEPHIRECLEQTITFAEMAREKSSSCDCRSSESMDVEKQASRDERENRGDAFVDDMASTDTKQESSGPSSSTNIVMDPEDLDMVCENENNDDDNEDDDDDDEDDDKDDGNESDVHDNEKDVNKFCCTQNVFDAACESPMGIRESNRSPINLQEELGFESDSLSESENMEDTSHKDLGAADELGLEKRVDSWLNEADKNSDVFNQSVSSEDNFVPVGIIDIRKRQDVSQSAFDQSNNDLSPSPCSRQAVLSPQSDRPVSQCCDVAASPTETPGHTEDKGYDESENLVREEEKEKHGPKVAEIVHEDKTLKSVEVRKTDNDHEVKTKLVYESTPSAPSLKLKIKLSGHTTVCSVGGLEEATEQTFEKPDTGKSGLKSNSDTSGGEEKDMEKGEESDEDGEGKESDEDGKAKELDEDGEGKESDEDGEEKESDKDGNGKEQENTGNTHKGIQDPSGNIEDPKWLEDLIDSSSTDSDSDIGSDPRSMPLSVSSVGEVCEVSTCAPAQKDITAHTNTDAYSRSESETQSDMGKQLAGADHKSGSLPCATKSLSFEANRPLEKEEQEKLRFSYVPARSAAVKALNKMKTDDTEDDEDGGGTGDSTRNKKSIGKSKSFKSSSVPSKSGSSSNVNRSSSHGKPSMSEASRQPGPRKPSNSYMCRYCIDISEGPLRKIKPHVLTKHSSMPPMVINCVKQRHHIRCRFYICPHHACYDLSETEEEFEAHKATHSGVSTEARKRKERTTLNSLSSTENRKKFSVSSENITDPSKRSLRMEGIASCRVELDMLNADILKSNGTVHLRQEKKYQCLYCTEYYYDKLLSGMKSHYAKEHEGQLMVMRDTEARKAQLPSRIYVCDRPNCESFYLNRSDLDSHAKSHKSNFTYFYECACCGWYSSSYSAANIHLSTEHGDEQSASLIQMQVSVDEYGQTSKRVL